MNRRIIFDSIENSELSPNTSIKANEKSGSIYVKSNVYTSRQVAKMINSGKYIAVFELIERS